MDSLTEYLRGPFLVERDELHSLRDTADEVLATLHRIKKNAEFPYEVAQDAVLSRYQSHSTSAMILFAMGVAVGQIGPSTLLPNVSGRNTDEMPDEVGKLHETVRREFKADLLQFQTNIETAKKTHTFKTSYSGTYGPDDPFTLLWLLELLRPFENDPDLAPWYGRLVGRATEKVQDVFAHPADPRKALDTPDAVEHVFPLLRVVHLNKHLKSGTGYKEPAHGALEEHLRNRLHLHLSYFSIPNSSFDAAELAFAMEALLLLDRNLLDSATVDRCRDVLAETQIKTPYWRPLRPFIATAQGKIILPLSVEIGNSLLRSCELLESRDGSKSQVSLNIPLFRKYTEWLFTRKVRGSALGDVSFVGWHSEHADGPQKIHPWESSQVQLYLLHYEAFLRRHRAAASLSLMNLKVKTNPQQQKKPSEIWADAKDRKSILRREPLKGLGANSEYAIFHRMMASYIIPRDDGGASERAHYSMLLYGPQGTGKTDVAENVARCLGKPLISISPSDFTVGGGAAVEARAQAIFDVLGAQTDAVILLDEIDRLILDRDSKAYERQTDIFLFMTPGMLTKFRDLRRMQRCIFIVSTNFADLIDPAIKRVGRIDDQYVVLPPDTEQRFQIIGDEMARFSPDPKDQAGMKALLEDVSRDDLNQVLRETALFIPGEMQNLCRKVFGSWRVGQNKSFLLNSLLEEARKTEATIRLSSYRTRFKWQNSSPQGNQEPYLEFLLLLYVLFESGRTLGKEEESIWNEAQIELKKKGETLSAALSVYLKDGKVLDTLLSKATS